DDVVRRRRCRGLHDRLVLPRRRSRRDLPQDVEAGLDPGRRHGRVLDRDLDRPAVRRPAGDVRLEVRQHALEPAGLTDDPDVRMAQSIMDYVFRRLALDYMSFEQRSGMGIYSAQERQRHLETGSYEPVEISEAESLKADA